MPPKAEKKKQEKIIEDRTFGLKNKNKSKAVQKFVKGVEQTVKHANISAGQLEAQQFEKKKLKKKEEQEQALLFALYRDVNKMKEEQEQEEDPRNIVCPYYKQGLCQKGKKCIYSHDLTMDRNEEIDLYVDQRTQLIMNAIGGKELTELSEEELNKMIGEKEGEMIKGFRSDIVCKFFLESVEKSKYGWNWSCPNGGDKCKYKHCLPPGYKLKKDGGSGKVEEEKIDIEAKIDQERHKLQSQNLSSPLVTFEVFMKWKEQRRIRKQADVEKKKKDDEKKNKSKGTLRTGRQLFSENPNLFVDDEEAADDYEQEEIVEEEFENQEQGGEDGDEDGDGDKIQKEEGEEDANKQEDETFAEKEEMPEEGHQA